MTLRHGGTFHIAKLVTYRKVKDKFPTNSQKETDMHNVKILKIEGKTLEITNAQAEILEDVKSVEIIDALKHDGQYFAAQTIEISRKEEPEISTSRKREALDTISEVLKD